MSDVKVLTCNCSHEGQDRIHGAGRRLHNRRADNGAQKYYLCTVCKNERAASSPKKR